jgi:hypothetical protein
MPTQGNSETGGESFDSDPYCAIVGPEEDQKLVLAETEDWAADKSAQIVCSEGHVDLAEWQ